VARAAAERGLTHLAITDHDRIDGALEARDHAPAGLTILVGEEIKTTSGDLIGVFLERAVPPGLSPAEAIAAVREQGGLVGIPIPSTASGTASLVTKPSRARRAGRLGGGPQQPPRRAWQRARVEFAREHGLPGVAVSDAHSVLESPSLQRAGRRPVDAGRPVAALQPVSLVTARVVPGPAPDPVRQGRPVDRGKAATDGSPLVGRTPAMTDGPGTFGPWRRR
jgi:hypothetical protein